MTEKRTETLFDQLELKTQVLAILSAAEPSMSLRTLLAVLGFDTKIEGPDNFDLEEIEADVLEKIKEYMLEYSGLSSEEKIKLKAQYCALGDNQIADYYLNLSGF